MAEDNMQDDLEAVAGSDGVSVHSGFPNPALGRRGQANRLALDLNQLLVRHPSSTYLFRISGHAYSDQGIYDGDIAVIERGKRQQPDTLAILWLDGQFKLCRQRELEAHETGWGTVTAVIHQYG